ncbi:MAG: TIGR04283 family arsenosugar biosynthesis glycosyltransferase [Vicinamibacterales bacterium]|nr:TIGR04283 family arsenosugar biosynthesis glycosyltransferase [Vicinamibacterales bacterium]
MHGNEPLVSVVVPVRDDAAALAHVLAGLPPVQDVELIVSATAEDEEALTGLRETRPDVRWVSGPAGRGTQLNSGAAEAHGRWLWFVHADSDVPPVWRDEFARLDGEDGVVWGSFAFGLISAAWQARAIEWAVGWRVRLFGLPYGDQGIFVRRAVFERMGGFAPLPLMEDVEFVRRLHREGRAAHLTVTLPTAARRWERQGWWRRSAANLLTLGLYAAGVSPERLARRYNSGSTQSSR